MAAELLTRDKIPQEMKWATNDIFANDQLWEEAYEKLGKRIGEFGEFSGKLGESADMLLSCLKEYYGIMEAFEPVIVYARENYDVDTTNEKYQALVSRANSLGA